MQNCVCAYLLCFMLSLRCKLVKRCVCAFTTLSCLRVSLSCIQATAQDEVRAGTVTLSCLHVSLFLIQATTRDEVRSCTNHIVMRACRLCFGKEQPGVHEEKDDEAKVAYIGAALRKEFDGAFEREPTLDNDLKQALLLYTSVHIRCCCCMSLWCIPCPHLVEPRPPIPPQDIHNSLHRTTTVLRP